MSVSELAPSRSPVPGYARPPAAAGPLAQPLAPPLALPRDSARPAAHRIAGSGRRAALIARAALPLADLAALAAAAALTGTAGPRAVVYTAAVLAILAAGGQHRLRICLRVSDQVGRIVTAALLPLPVLIMFAWTPGTDALRLALTAAGLVVACRAVTLAALRVAHRRGLLAEGALVIGTGVIGTQIAGLLREHPELGLVPQGFLGGAARPAGTRGGDAGPGRGEPVGDIPVADTATPVLGQLDDLTEVVGRHRISRVIVSFSGHDQDLVPVLRACRRLRADVCVVPRLYELGAAVPRACLDEVWGIPLIPLRRYGQPPSLLLKRAFDVLASTLLLAVAGPLLLMLALAVRLRCGPPALFRQVRVTGQGRLATIMKLRTLSEISDPDTSWVAATGQCTPLGRLLRATHLDELPQLVNVLRGDMSLVGPRPERPVFAGRFSREIPRYRDRNRMPAGMTGWAQIHGLNGDTSIRDRARFDNQYIEYWSFWLDLVILFRTFATTVAAATHRPSGSRHTSGSRIVHASGSAPPEAATSLPGSTQGDQK